MWIPTITILYKLSSLASRPENRGLNLLWRELSKLASSMIARVDVPKTTTQYDWVEESFQVRTEGFRAKIAKPAIILQVRVDAVCCCRLSVGAGLVKVCNKAFSECYRPWPIRHTGIATGS